MSEEISDFVNGNRCARLPAFYLDDYLMNFELMCTLQETKVTCVNSKRCKKLTGESEKNGVFAN